MRDNHSLGEIVVALIIVTATLIVLAVLSHGEIRKHTDPRWVSAAADIIQMVILMYIGSWVWRISHNLDALLAILSGDASHLNPNLTGLVALAVQKFKEAAQELEDNLKDGGKKD